MADGGSSFLMFYQEYGNQFDKSQDYFNIGSSVDFIEHNENHATLFYTSTTQFNATNYTSVNYVDILRFHQSLTNSTLYRTSTVINMFRDRSNDSIDLGRIGLSIYNSTILITQQKVIPN